MGQPESITDDLRAAILAGEFPPGERLVELRLTEHYDCGRLAVRTALVELASEGLVDREANRGATVRHVSVAEAIQIAEARAALESLIAAQAALVATAEERDELRLIGQHMVGAVQVGDAQGYSDLNVELHRRLREISGHHVAAGLVAQLRNRGAQHRFRLAQVKGRSAESVVQHQAIIDAVTAGRPDEAASAMKAHLLSVIDVLRSWPDDGVDGRPESVSADEAARHADEVAGEDTLRPT